MLDLSQVAPSARVEVGYDAKTFLYKTLSRIELPGLEFAFPTSTTYVTQEDGKSLQLSIAGETPLTPH